MPEGPVFETGAIPDYAIPAYVNKTFKTFIYLPQILISMEELDIKYDTKKVGAFFKKYKVVLLLIIPIFFAIFFRAYTYDLPITDSFAEESLQQNIKSQLQAQILQQTSDLDQATLDTLVNQQYQQYIKDNRGAFDQQLGEFSKQIKSFYQDDSGQTYLLAIDPYHYYRQAQNVLDNGHVGDELRDGQPLDNHMWGPKGSVVKNSFHPFIGATFHKISTWFGNDSLMKTMFILPLIFAALAVIPAFFIGRKAGGNLGGLVAAFVLAVHSTFIGRTPAGFSDTDAYAIFFPLMVIWLFLEAFTTQNKKHKLIFSGLAGLFTGFFAFAWSGWWYIFEIIIASMGIYFLYLLFKYKKTVFKKLKTKNLVKVALTYLTTSVVFVWLMNGTYALVNAVRGPLNILILKEAAKNNLWPNVYTTVAELNAVSFAQVIGSLGGKLWFAIAVVGILLVFLKKKKIQSEIKFGILMVIWFITMLYTTTKGIRFIMYVIPIFAIGIGIFYGKVYKLIVEKGSKAYDLNKKMLAVSLIILAVISFVPMTKAAHETSLREVPSMNDAWYTALTNIKEDAPENAIINSWWDFGHWFKAIADRAVTFDGASQNTPMAHWIGKVLITDNEEEAIAILRMLDCGENDAYNLVLEETDDPLLTKKIVDQIILEDENTARSTLDNYITNVDEVLEKTHCEPPADYFITSEDMVSKGGVWAHFGSWDFERAFAFNTIKTNTKENAVQILQERLGYSEEEAASTYRQLKGVDESEGNAWIAPYPNFAGLGQCQDQNGSIVCSNGVVLDLEAKEAQIQTDQGLMPLTYRDDTTTYTPEQTSDQIAAAYFPNVNQVLLMHPALLNSMFTELFYYNGKNLNNFELFDHQQGVGGFDIFTWKVIW